MRALAEDAAEGLPPLHTALPPSAGSVSATDVEARSGELLDADCWLQGSDLSALYHLLPKESPVRGDPGLGSSFSTGAFARIKVGLRTNVRHYPRFTRLAARYVRQQLPEHPFTSLAVFSDVATTPHLDARNSAVPNAVLALSSFTGGAVWVAKDGGPDTFLVQGELRDGLDLDLTGHHAVFSAKRLVHATRPWSGHRLVLVAFTVEAAPFLSAADCALLRELEFHVPSAAQLADAAAAEFVCRAFPRVLARPTATTDFPKFPPDPPKSSSRLVVELCAGDAQLSRCFAEAGFDTLAVDSRASRLHACAKVCNLSLSAPATWDFLHSVLLQHPVVFVFVSLPFGTCGRDFRDAAHLAGLPGLSPEAQQKLESADFVYRAVTRLLLQVHDMGIMWAAEAPSASLVWRLPSLQPLVALGARVSFDACCYGGLVRTSKSILTTVPTFLNLAQRCPHESHPKAAAGAAHGCRHPRPFVCAAGAPALQFLGHPSSCVGSVSAASCPGCGWPSAPRAQGSPRGS